LEQQSFFIPQQAQALYGYGSSALVRQLHLDTDEDLPAVHPVADEPEYEANHCGLQHWLIAAALFRFAFFSALMPND